VIEMGTIPGDEAENRAVIDRAENQQKQLL
jgi:hypothetical protein